MIKSYLTLATLLFTFSALFAQTVEVEDLEKKLEKTNGIEKVKILDQLSEYYLDSDLDKSVHYAETAIKISKKEEVPDTILGSIYNSLGAAYFYSRKYDKSLKYYEKELVIIQKNATHKQTIKALYNIAVLYKKSGKNKKSESYFKLSLENAKEIKSVDLILHNYKALYELYEEWGKYEEALEYLQLYINHKDSEYHNTQKKVTILRKKYEKERELRRQAQDNLDIAEIANSDLQTDTAKKSQSIMLLQLEKQLNARMEAQEEAINEAKFTLKNQELERKQFEITMYTIAVVITLIAAFWIFIMYRHKIRANKILSEQKSEIIEQAIILENTNLELAERNTQIIDSINYARRIQDSILMREDEIHKILPEAFIYYRPKDIVSGDFYWFSKIDDKIVIAAIDCTGHGVPGAFMSMIGNTLLNEIVNVKRITKPDDILTQLHTGVMAALQQKNARAEADDGMDISLCTIAPRHKRFQFAGAKNHLYVIQKDQLKILKANIHSIGGRPLRDDVMVEFTSYDFMYDENTLIYMMSDGYVDQFGGLDDRKFNSKRLKQMLLDNRALPMAEQKEVINDRFNEWKGERDQVDDILLLGIKLT